MLVFEFWNIPAVSIESEDGISARASPISSFVQATQRKNESNIEHVSQSLRTKASPVP
jgi:hypothetical protein